MSYFSNLSCTMQEEETETMTEHTARYMAGLPLYVIGNNGRQFRHGIDTHQPFAASRSAARAYEDAAAQHVNPRAVVLWDRNAARYVPVEYDEQGNLVIGVVV